MYLKCIRESEGFTVNKVYKLLGCAGEYVQVKGDDDKQYIMYESYFELVK